jgi:predicted RNase H-like nuclease (RuvC/YqgF family)
MNPDDEPRRTREGEDAGDTLRRLERTVEQLSRHTEELTRTVNETLTMLARRVEAIEREVFPAGAAGVH